MSLHVLDTDTVTLYQHAHPVVEQHIRAHPAGDVGVTVITIEEQLAGRFLVIRRAKRRDEVAKAYQRLTESVQFYTRLPAILSFPEPAILRYEQLKALKLYIGTMDLRITAITLENSAILVTRNKRDFQHIPGLVIEDWTV